MARGAAREGGTPGTLQALREFLIADLNATPTGRAHFKLGSYHLDASSRGGLGAAHYNYIMCCFT